MTLKENQIELSKQDRKTLGALADMCSDGICFECPLCDICTECVDPDYNLKEILQKILSISKNEME